MIPLWIAFVSYMFMVALAAPAFISRMVHKVSKSVDSMITFIGQGMPSLAIDASGVPSTNAWKGFPNLGVAPMQIDHDEAAAYSKENCGVIPEGINPVNCTIKDGQRPIILIPGTGEQVYDNWAYMGPRLAKEEGLCVYSFNHNPFKNLARNLMFKSAVVDDMAFFGDITSSASALSTFVDEILDRTGSQEVDLVGHSQGAGALPFYYLKNLGGSSKVRKMISIAPSLGTDGNSWYQAWGRYITGIKIQDLALGYKALEIAVSAFNGKGTVQQLWNSPFMVELHKGGLGVPGVEYFNIATKAENILMPYTRCLFNATEGIQVTNAILQDFCYDDYSNHHYVSYSPNVYTIVKNYLYGIEFENITCEDPPYAAQNPPNTYPVVVGPDPNSSPVNSTDSTDWPIETDISSL